MTSNNQLVSYRPGKPEYDVKRGLYRLAALLGLAGVTVIALKKYHSFFTAFFKMFSHAEKKKETDTVKLDDSGVKMSTSSAESPLVTPETNNNNEMEPDQPAAETTEQPLSQEPEKPKVLLHLPPRGYQTPSVSPFALKLETFLRISDIPYDVNFSTTSILEEHLPWMTIGDENIYESITCIEKLREHFDIDFEGKALRSRRIASNLVDAALENHLYWGITLWRWIYDEGRSLRQIQPISAQGRAKLPRIISAVREASWHHALGRLTPEQVKMITFNRLDDLSAALGKNEYFLGKSPGTVDCGAFAILSQMLWNMPGAPFEGAMRQHANLVSFVCRMRDNYWPDWEQHLTNQEELQAPQDTITPGTEFLRKPYAHSDLIDSKRTSAATILHSHGNYTSDSQATVSCVSSFKCQRPRRVFHSPPDEVEDYEGEAYQCIPQSGTHPLSYVQYAATSMRYPQPSNEQHRRPYQNSYASGGPPAHRIASFSRSQTRCENHRHMATSATRMERNVHFDEQSPLHSSQYRMNGHTRVEEAGVGAHAVDERHSYHRQRHSSQPPPLSVTGLHESVSRCNTYYPQPGFTDVPHGSSCSVRQHILEDLQNQIHERSFDTNNNPGYKPQGVPRGLQEYH